jgi:hypothetical protein
MDWLPKPGDRVKTVITKDKEHEIIYLNGDHAIETTVSNEFLTITGVWVPWAHQIIDHLSKLRNMNRSIVLQQLLEFERFHTELDFDELCLLFLEEYNAKQQQSISEVTNERDCINTF